MSTPKRILDHLESVLGATSAPVRLVSVIEAELVSHFGLESIAAAERAEQVLVSVSKLITIRSAEADTRGVSATLVLFGSTDDYAVGSLYVLPTDSSTLVSAKRGRLQHASLLSCIRSLTFAEFELFGKRVLKELGAREPKVTPHGGDQGIDFFGDFCLGQLEGLPRPFFMLSHDVKLLFAGQAKHYPNSSLGTNIVRELIGSVSLARTKTFSTDGLDIFKDLDIRPFSPVIALLFTTGDITSGAYRLSANAGIVAKSGEQLAAFLADRGVGLDPKTAQFDKTTFFSWLNG